MKTSPYLLLAAVILTPLASEAGGEWIPDSQAALVLGQPGFEANGASLTAYGMNEPSDVAVDPVTGKVFVADKEHSRVLRFASYESLTYGSAAEAVFGKPDATTGGGSGGSSGMYDPTGLAIQEDGTLWVADSANHRVLRLDDAATKASGSAADGVLGAPNMNVHTPGVGRAEMWFPVDVAVDADGTLYVVERTNNRVLVFKNADSLPNGADADSVLGQEDFDGDGTSLDADGMDSPKGVAVDSEGNLYVADTHNTRVLRFDDASSKPSGADADAVFGQVDFMTHVEGSYPDKFRDPVGLAFDGLGRLWVCEEDNNRITGLIDPANATNGAAPDLVIGQPDLESYDPGLSSSRMNAPSRICIADGRMWVADTDNNRVIVFEKTPFQPDFTIGKKSTSQKGDDVYSSSGSGQKQSKKTDAKEVKFVTKIQNDGDVADRFLLGSAKTNSKVRVKVFRVSGGRANITGAAKLGTHLTEEVDAGASLTYELKGKPKGKFKDRKKDLKIWIEASSMTEGSVDRVKGTVKNRPK